MTEPLVNGAPMEINYGVSDKSTRTLPVNRELIPQHLPLQFVFSPRGNKRFIGDGPTARRILGDAAFDIDDKYYNRSTLFAEKALSKGNSVMFDRLIPDNAGPKSNAILWLDVLETTVSRFRRNPDGSIFLDPQGEPEITGTTPGIKAKWVKTFRDTKVAQQQFATSTQMAGDQTDADTGAVSVRYPIFEIEEGSYGEDGNNTGFRLWAPTTSGGVSVPLQFMQKNKVYPYVFAAIKRKNKESTPVFETTLSNETQLFFSFRKNVTNPATAQKLGYDQVIVPSYNQSGIPGFPDVEGRISKFHVYEENINTITELMYTYESDFISGNTDITEDETTHGLMNFVTGVSSRNIPYESFIFVDSPTSVRMSEYSNVYLEGGSDGTMTDEVFEDLVRRKMDDYLDPNHEVQDIAYNVESVLYDVGFSLETKYKLINFISIRRNTYLILATHVANTRMTESEEYAISVALRTRLRLNPESTYFGTEVGRALIQGRSGVPTDSLFTGRVPLTYTLMGKFAEFMGASDGRWKGDKSPTGVPGSLITDMADFNITHVPKSVRNKNWAAGLNWILKFDRERCFLPSYKTVYGDDTSVLNSIFVMAAIAYLNTVTHRAWASLSGRDDLSLAQICQETNKLINAQVEGKFAGRYTVVPASQATPLDDLRGFTWTTPVRIGANNARTVMFSYIEAYRLQDLPA